MAATNYTPIQLYYSTTASAAPTAGNLVNGELAINITDGKLYYKDNGGNVQVIATKGAGTIGGSNTQIQFNDGGALAGNAAMVFNKSTNVTTLTTLNLTNALGATYGGTAQSAYAQGDLLYASAVNTLSKLTIGTVNYILTSTGSVPQWVAPSSVTVQTANNLAGGAGGSVPYQSAADTTTFLAIGAANRVMTSSGSAPQWVTSLTGLTGVSSSSMTNTSLTSGRLVYSTTGGAQTDSANLTFNGTTLSMTGLSNTGFSTIVKTVTLGDSNFNGAAVFAPATPAKLYIGTGTVTDVTSAASATNTAGAITAFGITPIAATNTSVTYTNASTLYIAGAPTAGTNVTITNPYSLYVAGGAAYFGGAVTVAGTISLAGVTVTSLTDSGLTSGRVTYATTGGLLTDSANLLYSGTDLTVYGITVGRGAGAVSTNTAVGAGALAANTTGKELVAVGTSAAASNTTGSDSVYVGRYAGYTNTTGTDNVALGDAALWQNTTGSYNTAVGRFALASNTTAGSSTAVGYQAAYSNTTGINHSAFGYQAAYSNTSGSGLDAFGYQALFANTTGSQNAAFGAQSLYRNTTGADNTAIGLFSLSYNTTGNYNVAVGESSLRSNTTASNNTAVGYQAGYSNITGNLDAFGYGALYSNTTGTENAAFGGVALYANTTGNSNVALGKFALRFNTTASNNTAVGYQAGYNTTTTGLNTFIGNQAGYGNTTGANNTIVGHQAGYAFGSSLTGNNNLFLGYQAGFYVTSGAKNTIIGSYNGNQGGLDIRTANNYIVLSDGDGNPRIITRDGGWSGVKTNPAVQYDSTSGSSWQVGGSTNIYDYSYTPTNNLQTRIYHNTYLDTFAVDKYLNTGYAAEILMGNGAIDMMAAASGTAGNTVSFTTVLSTWKDQTVALQGATKQTGTGITFPATQNASSNANTLDDYEEGTWTPTYVNGVTSPNYQDVFGYYTKIGRFVQVVIRMQLSSGTANASQVQIGGLPFAASSGGGSQGAFTLGYQDNWLATGFTMLGLSTSTQIDFYKPNGGNLLGTEVTDIKKTLHITGTYFV